MNLLSRRYYNSSCWLYTFITYPLTHIFLLILSPSAEIEEITEEVLDRKIAELVASRGRKNTDPREVLRKLEVLSKASRPLGPRKVR